MKIYRYKKNFNLDSFLSKPLFAHLATVDEDFPRDSPVWFHWEDEKLWIIGTPSDTFPIRIRKNPKCAIGIVEYDKKTGLVLHAGFRGRATVEPFDNGLACRLLSKYMGVDKEKWDPRFQFLDDSNMLIRFIPETVVVRDQSYTVSY
ncbi:pyridoxamine 5'-phosphate oxidase family protein [Salipaludibacillus aurantiacus]|uniref:Pyridoxamine 5'-phosphate oxidase n=1 Tax=Salipaludibacillus aurantiacus TaxID=1601833 RepID=A0A1H9W4J6_9BACI|nr:pyridoxamine 5'-phosphate oxidase family protein [Salipaludibacillus aurantiacus]SES28880.1 Pyridoxamine 5'-phosphate oxidase [Salipaludibacillus aurantiacus]